MAKETAANTAMNPRNMNAGTRCWSRTTESAASGSVRKSLAPISEDRTMARTNPAAKNAIAIANIGAHSRRAILCGGLYPGPRSVTSTSKSVRTVIVTSPP